MKPLYVALSLCVVCYVFASEDLVTGLGKRKSSSLAVIDGDIIAGSFAVQSFMKAAQEGNMIIATEIFNNSDTELRKACVKHLINLRNPLLVAQLINTAEDNNGLKALEVFLMHADQPFIDEIFEVLNPSDELLGGLADSANLACIPDKYIHFLEKFTDKATQEYAITKTVEALFENKRIECLDPLLSALESKISLSTGLKNAAIRTTFWAGSRYKGMAFWTKRFFDHPVISAVKYSRVLYNVYAHSDPTKELFCWLLERADRQDLEEVKRDRRFYEKRPEFRKTVKDAQHKVCAEPRHGMTHRKRVAATKEALGMHIIDVLLDLIGEYIEG